VSHKTLRAIKLFSTDNFTIIAIHQFSFIFLSLSVYPCYLNSEKNMQENDRARKFKMHQLNFNSEFFQQFMISVNCDLIKKIFFNFKINLKLQFKI